MARGGGSGVGDGVVARSRTFSSHPLLHLRLNGIQAHILPAILDLDVGEGETVLKHPGHLQNQVSIMLDCQFTHISIHLGHLHPSHHPRGNLLWVLLRSRHAEQEGSISAEKLKMEWEKKNQLLGLPNLQIRDLDRPIDGAFSLPGEFVSVGG